jgi:hypothetical protein
MTIKIMKEQIIDNKRKVRQEREATSVSRLSLSGYRNARGGRTGTDNSQHSTRTATMSENQHDRSYENHRQIITKPSSRS